MQFIHATHTWPREFIQDDNLFYNGLFKVLITIGFHNPRGKSRSMDRGKRFTMKNKKTEGREKCKHKHQNKRRSLLNSEKKEAYSHRLALNVATGLIA